MGGTLELFHAGLMLIVLGAIGWFLRHGPLSVPPGTPVLASFQSAQPVPASTERPAVKPGKTKATKVKASTVKRRHKKAKTRRQHVQR